MVNNCDLKNLRPIVDDYTAENQLVMAGPCSAESPQQVAATASGIAAAGVNIFRAGAWKPRTRPGGFEGYGTEALGWIAQVKKHWPMLTATEVATPRHVREALDAGIDILWIGARTSSNPFAIQEIADYLSTLPDVSNIPVLVKNPISPDLELWIGAMQRLYGAGIRRLGAIHRGFTVYGSSVYRNEPLWHIPIELKVRYPHLPVIHDPSHTAGTRHLIEPLSRRAVDLGFDGLIIECHDNPDEALSDAVQQITPARLDEILRGLSQRAIPDVEVDNTPLDDMRRRIDVIDAELLDVLARRMAVSREIGEYKRVASMPALQSTRFNSLITDRLERGLAMGIDRDFLKKLLLEIHSESVRQQIDIFERTN